VCEAVHRGTEPPADIGTVSIHIGISKPGDIVMTTNFASLRQGRIERLDPDSVGELSQTRQAMAGLLDADEELDAETFELPGADLSGEELTATVVPPRPDEFICAGCFLIFHRSRLASRHSEQTLCRDCA
jgi:hypothetical protein